MVAAGRKAELEVLGSIRLDSAGAVHITNAIRTLRRVARFVDSDHRGVAEASSHSVPGSRGYDAAEYFTK
jgi:hypothetical protein